MTDPADPADPPTPRFLCDAMLGRLARDLRLLGYDAAWSDGADADDDGLRRRAEAEGLVLLTRDVALARAAGVEPLRSLDPERQLREVVESLGLRPDPAAFLSRCGDCNVALAPGAGGTPVPPDVEEVRHCPSCRRAFWEGTHVAGMRRRFGPFWPHSPGPPPS